MQWREGMSLLLTSRPGIGNNLGTCAYERQQPWVVQGCGNDAVDWIASFVAYKIYDTAKDVHRSTSSCHNWMLHKRSAIVVHPCVYPCVTSYAWQQFCFSVVCMLHMTMWHAY